MIFQSLKIYTNHINLVKIDKQQIKEIHELEKIDPDQDIYIDSLIFSDEEKILIASTTHGGERKIYLDILEDGELKNIHKLEGRNPFLYKDKEGKYWLFYNKKNEKIFYMTSLDGLDWSDHREIENSLKGISPKLYQTSDGTYWLIYAYCTNCEPRLIGHIKRDLCYQTSTDGENWSDPIHIVHGGNISPRDILETNDGRIILVWSDWKCGDLSSVLSGKECGRIYVKIYDEEEVENDKIPFHLKNFVKSFVVSLVLVFIFYFLISVFYILFFGGGKGWRG